MNSFKKKFLILLGFLILFLVLRLPAVYQPYHQDEYKWPLYAEEIVYEPGSVPHPPLTEFIYRIIGQNIGFDNFRFIPLFFGFVNLFLIFYLVRSVYGKKEAFWVSGLYVISFYSILANLMVDVDGSVMPFFFLLMISGYFKWKAENYGIQRTNYKWIILMLLGIIGGILIKMSFFIGVLAIAIDFVIEKGALSDRKKIIKYFGYGILAIVGFVLVLIGIRFIFPFFDLSKALKYWQHFVVFAGRGWGQTFIQFAKSILYISPLLLLPIFLIEREIFKKLRPLFIFILTGLFFYLIAFDFSIGALDRYFQFLVIPLSIISSVVFAKYINTDSFVKNKSKTIFWIVISIAVFLLQFFNHSVLPHHPKNDWLERVVSLKWNFVFPFSGGSGPTGFYISFAFIAVIWVILAVFMINNFLRRNKYKEEVLVGILIIGLVYNFVFTEEYLYGRINGSPVKLFKEAHKIILEDNNINSVIVYNDIGGYKIKQSGKYFRRLYANPEFEETYREVFNNFSGHLLFIDIPHLNENSFYYQYISSCKPIFESKDKYIKSEILSCKNE